MDIEAKAREAWQDLLEKDDRTSPEDYPDMVLITFEELRAIIDEAHRAGSLHQLEQQTAHIELSAQRP
jgi:hypothetical protein